VGAALVLAGVAWWWWMSEPGGPLADLLDFVPSDALVVGRVRLAEMTEHLPKVRAGEVSPSESLFQRFGLHPEMADLAWIVWHRPLGNFGWVVVRTRSAYRQRDLLSRLREVEAVDVGGRTMHQGRAGRGQGRAAVAFIDSRTFLAGSISGVRLALELVKMEKKGEKPTGWSDDHVAEVRARPPEWLGELEGPFVPAGLKALKGMKNGKLTLSLRDEAVFAGSLELAGEAEAREAAEGAQQGVLSIRAILLLAQVQGGQAGAAAVLLDRLLGSARVEASGSMVRAVAAGNKEEVLRALAALPDLLDP
jgi:hypothetical protein